MPRGLSELQATILFMAQENVTREGERQPNHGADVYLREVLAQVYGLGGRLEARADFGKRYTGDKPTRVARSAVSRAFRRLEERGLVCRMFGRYWAGVNLTETGREWLSVNRRATYPPVDR